MVAVKSSIGMVEKIMNIKVRQFINFPDEQSKFVHQLRTKISEIQRPNQKEGEIFYDKIAFKREIDGLRLPVPKTYSSIQNLKDFQLLWDGQKDLTEFVFKPNHLSQGLHIHSVKKTGPDQYTELNGTTHDTKYFRLLTQKILERPHVHKAVLLEEMIHSHPDFKKWYVYDGIMDMRIYCLYDTILCGKMRLPTKSSQGYGNTGRNGCAVFINPSTGIIEDPGWMDNIVTKHPDLGITLVGEKVPFWKEMCQTATVVAKHFKLPFHSVDMTVNENGVPIIIEGEKIPLLSHFTKKGSVEVMDLIKKYSGGK